MIVHPTIRALCVDFSGNQTFDPLASYLTGIQHLKLEIRDRVPANLDGADVPEAMYINGGHAALALNRQDAETVLCGLALYA